MADRHDAVFADTPDAGGSQRDRRERYAVIPDEAIRYALGRFGRPNIPIAAEVMERIESQPRTRELRTEPPMAPLSELRARLGPNCRRRVSPAGHHAATQVDAMRSAGRRRATTIRSPGRSWTCCAGSSGCATSLS